MFTQADMNGTGVMVKVMRVIVDLSELRNTASRNPQLGAIRISVALLALQVNFQPVVSIALIVSNS